MSSLPIRHDEAKKTFQSKLGEIVEEDPYLGDLPKDVTLDEAKGFVALSSGQALAVTLVKYDGEEIPIVVSHGATVRTLKKVIRQTVALKSERAGDRRRISWKYVWKTYWLYYNNQKLTDDNARINQYGMHDQCKLGFVKRLRKEDKPKRLRHPPAKQ
ncbi:U11/U12 small nuclear ribonucleoprotein 25 kDa protein-like [Oscarella lobularis]|uniref:U11/U12 small nuclear ribonucleoprotein 25 kDa protein-like n=1 Tax=Oscarella lobularis TaxID=121494 RepID=UPI00331427DE